MNASNAKSRRQQIETICAEMGLDRFAAKTVEKWIELDPSTWPSCCLSGCDPCNDVLRAAARKVLAAQKP